MSTFHGKLSGISGIQLWKTEQTNIPTNWKLYPLILLRMLEREKISRKKSCVLMFVFITKTEIFRIPMKWNVEKMSTLFKLFEVLLRKWIRVVLMLADMLESKAFEEQSMLIRFDYILTITERNKWFNCLHKIRIVKHKHKQTHTSNCR